MKLILLPFLFFAVKRLLSYLHYFQQEEYDSRRFLHWIGNSRSLDTRLTLGIIVFASIAALFPAYEIFAQAGLAVCMLALAWFERDPRKSGKKPLAMTSRAKRILGCALVLIAALGALIAFRSSSTFLWIIAVQALPIALVAANLLLDPYEKSVQKKFWNEGHSKLLALGPHVVGVTGSYGKTSVKHIIAHILSTQVPSLATPGSVNTPMGVSRIIRERLQRDHRFFICEMGAYGPGSIARMCRLAPPNSGVISAIGYAHHERFGSLDAVARTKFELAEAVLNDKNGVVVVAEQVMEVEYAREFVLSHRARIVLVGRGADCDCRIVQSALTRDGIYMTVSWKQQSYELKAPLYGEHHVINMALAFANVCLSGVDPDDARIALASSPQIAHRLEVKKQPDGGILVDDAYNSNPTGFAAAVQLLSVLRKDDERRILVTPGMVELGTTHDEQHEIIGKLAAEHVDILLAVVPGRLQSLMAAYSATKPDGKVVQCADFAAARAWLEQNRRPTDIVLLENDLPDLYERKLAI